MGSAIRKKLEWFMVEGSIQQAAIAFTGEDNPSFSRVQEYAKSLLEGMEPLLHANLPLIVVVENDMAKVLGQTMYHLLEWKKEVICLDASIWQKESILTSENPYAGGCVLPVVVKNPGF